MALRPSWSRGPTEERASSWPRPRPRGSPRGLALSPGMAVTRVQAPAPSGVAVGIRVALLWSSRRRVAGTGPRTLFTPGAGSRRDGPWAWTRSSCLLPTGGFPVSRVHRVRGADAWPSPETWLRHHQMPRERPLWKRGSSPESHVAFRIHFSSVLHVRTVPQLPSAVGTLTPQNRSCSCVEAPRVISCLPTRASDGSFPEWCRVLPEALLWHAVLIGVLLGFPRTPAGCGGDPGLKGLSIGGHVHG